MTKIIDAKEKCDFVDRKFFFDTNVWIAVYGNDPRRTRRSYSDYYASILKSGNVIVVNDYVLGEYFNRACKMEYELFYEDKDFSKFKARRKSKEFEDSIQSVRDTCLNILDDCEYQQTNSCDVTVSKWITEAATGKIDFNDIALRQCCRENGFIIVTHDADFVGCGLDLVTANPRLLGAI